MNRNEQKRLDAMHATIDKLATGLTNARCERLVRDWKRTRTSRLRIKFGMGTELVLIREMQTGMWDDRMPRIIREAIGDICDITGNYSLACPDDIDTDAPAA